MGGEPGVPAAADVLGRAVAAQGDAPDWVQGVDRPEQVAAVAVGQADVADQQVEPLLAGQGQGRTAEGPGAIRAEVGA